MTIADLRALAQFHRKLSEENAAKAALARVRLSPTADDVVHAENCATWHEQQSRKLSELADAFQAFGPVIKDITQ